MTAAAAMNKRVVVVVTMSETVGVVMKVKGRVRVG